ncbi:MAG: PQQ-binding-like beta-propeller repeat protein [Bacteroidetes bacterium]|nr:PQQ-binding-like beta-propeller repeat protein [Bacteroidota bacterium]
MRKIGVVSLGVLLYLCSVAQVPKWNIDVGEQIKYYTFLNGGKYLFLTNYEYTWLFDSETGKKIYEFRVKDWEKKGMHELIGERFFLSTSDELHCYDALTGKLLWKQTYSKIDQDEYTNYSIIGNTLILRYGESHIGIDAESGKEKYRMRILYNGDLKDAGSWNWTTLNSRNYLLVLMDDEKLGLFDFTTGAKVLELKDYEISIDAARKGHTWFYQSPDERYCLFILDDGFAIVDVANLKEIYRIKTKYDFDYPPILKADFGCAVLSKEKIYIFNPNTAMLTEVPAEVKNFRTYHLFDVEGKNILLAGLSDEMVAIDLNAGNILWRTKKDDPMFEGYAHRYLGLDGQNALIVYSNSTGRGGSTIALMSINLLTGSVQYKTKNIFNSKEYIPEFARSITMFIGKNINKDIRVLDYSKLAFEYHVFEYNGKYVFASVSTNRMRHPETLDDGGDGIAVIDPKTGEILYRDYVEVSDYTMVQPHEPKEVPPYFKDGILVVTGEKGIAAYNVSERKRLFYYTHKVVPREVMVVNGMVVMKFGEFKNKIVLEPPKTIFGYLGMVIEKKYDEDPYGFIAYDLSTGKILWKVETKLDPAFTTYGFSLENNYDSVYKRLYYADEENIYAIKCTPDGGNNELTVNLPKAGIGRMKIKEAYIIREWPVGYMRTTISVGPQYTTVSTTAVYEDEGMEKFIEEAVESDSYCEYVGWAGTIWGAVANRCLGFFTYGDKIFVTTNEAVATLNAKDGKVIWKHTWDYDPKEFQLAPRVYNGKYVYCLDRMLTCVDVTTGEVVWKNKEAKRPLFFASPNEKYLYVVDEEKIRGYELEKQ